MGAAEARPAPWRAPEPPDTMSPDSAQEVCQMSPIDPNEVRLTGENSFIRLAVDGGETTTHASHWRVLLSPAGAGHALLLKSDLTGNELRVYSDNIALARWLQEDIEGSMRPDYADQGLPVIEASFSREGDVRTYWTERVDSAEESLSLTWYGLGEPYAVRNEAGSIPDQPHGVYSCIVPAARAQVTLDGRVATGDAFQRDHGGRPSSSCCLAFSETWVRPRGS